MKNFVEKNEEILQKWEQEMLKNGEENFAPDGIMYRGKIERYENGSERLDSEKGIENKEWSKTPLRILYLTKDQNVSGDGAWDVRGETGRKFEESLKIGSSFHRSLMYQLYGIVNTTPKVKALFPENERMLIDLYDSYIHARINVKKEGGNSSIKNPVLVRYMNQYKDLLVEQIRSLDADVFICCGYSDSVEKTGNVILNFLNENLYSFEKVNNWISYDKTRNKIAINTYHLSARISYNDVFEDMTQAYYEFLVAHPDFLEKIRASR